jgi:dipeptidyl aminopeptidase/acylaminoacyl peptidase
MHRPALPPLVFCLLLLAACSPAPSTNPIRIPPRLVYLQMDPSGTSRLVVQKDLLSSPSTLNFPLPGGCAIYSLHPNPVEPLVVGELLCGDTPGVQVAAAIPDADLAPWAYQDGARFLAWSADGRFLYLKSDFADTPHVTRLDWLDGRTSNLPLPSGLYDLAALPGGRIVYSLTRGLGFGSETWLADADGGGARQILARPLDVVAYLRPSPDGSRIAFITIPDSQTPFTVGELWVMDSDGGSARALAAADAGHGYAPAWSPDGTEIAFVVRENPDDPRADTSAGALLSNVYRLDVRSGKRTPVTAFSDAIVESPVWSPDGTALVFNVVKNGAIQVWYDDFGTLQPLGPGTSCCAVWVPGR